MKELKLNVEVVEYNEELAEKNLKENIELFKDKSIDEVGESEVE